MDEEKKDTRTTRTVSPEARAASSRNLSGWRSKATARANDLQHAVDAYRDALLRDAGPNPSATKVGLIEASVLTYASILTLQDGVINSRKSDLATLTERASWSASNLARLLKLLNLDAKPRPRTLLDLPVRN